MVERVLKFADLALVCGNDLIFAEGRKKFRVKRNQWIAHKKNSTRTPVRTAVKLAGVAERTMREWPATSTLFLHQEFFCCVEFGGKKTRTSTIRMHTLD